jgi:hypothetical protein
LDFTTVQVFGRKISGQENSRLGMFLPPDLLAKRFGKRRQSSVAILPWHPEANSVTPILGRQRNEGKKMHGSILMPPFSCLKVPALPPKHAQSVSRLQLFLEEHNLLHQLRAVRLEKVQSEVP